MLKPRICTLLVIGSLLLIGCTKGSNGSPNSSNPIGSIIDSIGAIISPNPSNETAKKEISKIKEEENKSSTYSLNKSEIQDLQAQVDITAEEQAELNTWIETK